MFLNANVAAATGTVSTTLGISTTINSLNVTQYGTNTIAADGSTLTISALADTGSGGTLATAGNAINIASGANAFTINAPLVMGGSGASQTYTNASASPFTINGTITGTAIGGNTQTLTLANASTGSTTIARAISDVTGGGQVAVQIDNTGSGVTYLQGSNTFSGGLTLTAGTLSISGGTSTSLGAGSVTINGGTFDLAGSTTVVVNNLSGTGGDITSSVAGASPTFANTTTTSFAGTIDSGVTGGITVSGSGILALTGANSYTGGTLLSGSTLRTNTDASLGNDSGALTFNGGTLQLTGSYSTPRNYTINSGQTALIDVQGYTLTDSGAISNASGTGGLTLSSTGGGGTLVLNNTETYAGPTTVSTGATLRIGASGILPANTLAAGSNLVLNGTGTLDLGGNSITLTGLPTGTGGIITSSSGTPTLTMNASGTVGAALAGSLGLVKTGTGSLTLTGNNSFTGGTVISQGTLIANNSGSTEIAMGASTNTLTLGNSSTGSNPVVFEIGSSVAGQVNLASISTSNYGTSQTIILNSGSALGGGAESVVTTLNLAGDVPLMIEATNTGGHSSRQDIAYRIIGNGIPAGSTALTLNGTAAALRISFPNGSAANNFTGNVVIEGTVNTQDLTYNGQTPGNQNLGFLNNDIMVNSGATWSIVWGGETIGALNGSGSISLFNQNALNNIGLTIGNNNDSGFFTGNISNSTSNMGIAKVGTGTQTLGGSDSYGGTTAISGGALRIDSNGALGSSSGASVSSGAALQLQGGITTTNANPLTLNGTGVAASPSGALESVSGNNTYSGLITLGSKRHDRRRHRRHNAHALQQRRDLWHLDRLQSHSRGRRQRHARRCVQRRHEQRRRRRRIDDERHRQLDLVRRQHLHRRHDDQ